MSISIRPIEAGDLQRVAEMRAELWPSSSAAEHLLQLEGIAEGRIRSTLAEVTFVAETENGEVAGFLDAGLRSHADGCDPARPAGYIEGWFVTSEFRRRGIGKLLVQAAETWARQQGCLEIASDTWIDNIVSQRAHEQLGYEVVDRCVHFRKSLQDGWEQ